MVRANYGSAARLAGALLIASLLAGCAGKGEMGSTVQPQPSEEFSSPLETYLPSDLCAGPPGLGFDLAAASAAPAMPVIDPGTSPTPPALGELGAGGASELASALAPADTFCSLAVSEPAMLAIAQAMRLVEQGKPQEARAVLAEWLKGQGLQPGNTAWLGQVPGPGAKLAAPVPLGDSARQGIRDLLNAAAADQVAGGDGAAYSNAANQAFRDLFAGEIGDAGFGDSLRLAEEALRLGETELGETASNRARKIWEEKLQADLEDFDPCTATEEEVRDLLNSLAQAMLLGVQGSFEGDGKSYTAVKEGAQAAVQQMFNQAAMKIGLPQLTSPVPECTPGGHIEVRQTLAFAKAPCIDAIPFTLTWTGSTAALEGSGATECAHDEANLGGSSVTLHQKMTLTLSFSGTATSGSPGTLQVTLTTGGEIVEYYSGFPEDSAQIFTEQTPFRVPADGTFPLEFEFREGAQAEITNTETGEAAFVMILHLITAP